MRHRRKFNHLSRTSAHRKAMLANMASSLILHKRIKTTLAKAKALRSYVEPLITRSKDDSTHSRRMVFKHLQNKDAVKELFREVSIKSADRPGGYTRILKLGTRLGDNAEMCLIELVDFNENLLTDAGGAKKKSTRRGRRGGAKKTEAPAATVDTAVAEPTEAEIEETAEAAVEEEQPAAEAEVKEEVPEAEVKETAPEAKEEAPEPEPKAEEKPEAKVEEKPEEAAPAAEVKEEKPEPEAKKEEQPQPEAKKEEKPEPPAEEKKEEEAKPEEPRAEAKDEEKKDEDEKEKKE